MMNKDKNPHFVGSYVDVNGHKHHTVYKYDNCSKTLSSARDLLFINKADNKYKKQNFKTAMEEAFDASNTKSYSPAQTSHVCFYIFLDKNAVLLHEIVKVESDGSKPELKDVVVGTVSYGTTLAKALAGVHTNEILLAAIVDSLKKT